MGRSGLRVDSMAHVDGTTTVVEPLKIVAT